MELPLSSLSLPTPLPCLTLLVSPAFKKSLVSCCIMAGCAVDNTLLVAVGTLALAPWLAAIVQLLNYCATHPDATVRFHASDMVLHIHYDASYLSEAHARRRAGGYFFLSDRPLNPSAAPLSDSCPPPLLNNPVHVPSTIMLRVVLSSATEAEMGALFYNAKDAAWLRTTLEDLGHPQPPTPIQTDNACAAGIIKDTVKQRCLKAIDMRSTGYATEFVRTANSLSTGAKAPTIWLINSPNITHLCTIISSLISTCIRHHLPSLCRLCLCRPCMRLPPPW